MADVKLNTLPQSTSPTSTQDLLLFDESTNAGQRINYNTLADVILAKLTSKTYTVGGGTQTLISAIDALNSNMWKKASVTIPAGQTKSLVAGREELSCFVSITGPQTNIRAGLYYLSGYTTATRVTLVPLNASDNISFDMTNETTVTIPITNSSANPATLTVFVLRKTGSDITFQ